MTIPADPDPPPIWPGDLSHREAEVATLIARGHLREEIAALLGISVRTVDSHRSAAIEKTGARSSVHLARMALRLGIVQLGEAHDSTAVPTGSGT